MNKTMPIGLTSLIIVVAAVAWLFGSSHQETYEVISTTSLNDQNLQEKINAEAKQGWKVRTAGEFSYGAGVFGTYIVLAK